MICLPVDNTPIHSPDVVDYIIPERNYSPELNPIEVFWRMQKHSLQELFKAARIDVPVERIQNFIQHSIDVFPKFLNKEPL
ncbi:hypothetical protein EDC94DRAFT_517029 [Helicostylum pulchrum]|nr:hypothetical protein EDC94DRAFT_517029 [Helicostylum pulchrum]